MRHITVAIPYYNRSNLIMETINPLLGDVRVNEIILCDDCSNTDDYYKMIDQVYGFKKIKVVKNVTNHHVQHSKRNAISFAKNDWVIVIDNDNIIDSSFIDKLYDIKEWKPEILYHPAFASPNFDYREINGHIITKSNVSPYTDYKFFVTLLNTNNYFINRNEYLKVYKYNKECRGSDGIYNNYNWLKYGNKIHVVEDLTYFHRVHPQSEFLREVNSNMKLIYYWLDQVKQLK